MTTQTQTSLQVRRVINAPREKVFQAFTDPALIGRWYHPGPMRTEVRKWDATQGGTFDIAMIADEGEMAGTHEAHGTFQAVEAGRKLVHTWSWKSDDPNMNGESVVTVELKDADGGTEVILTHERLPNKESVESHTHGWVGCLENLVALYA